MADRYASLKQGLVGCWIPSVSGSGLLLPDLSGRGNNGSLVGMDASDWVSGQYGRALDFDGSNDQVTAGAVNSFSFMQNTHVWTCSTWLKLSSTASAQQIIGNTPFDSADKGFALFYETGRGLGNGVIRAGVTRASGVAANTYQFRSADNSIANTSWYHVCAGMSGQGLPFIFINGVSQAITVLASDTTLSTGDSTRILGMGYSPYTSILIPLAGQLDDIRIYSRVLTEPEIRLLASEPGIGFKPAKKLSRFSQRFTYNPPKARNYGVVRVKETDYATLRQGLVGAWCPSLPNGGGGNTLPDVSGYNNHGTLTNMGPEDWVSSQYGRALEFDGTNDYVTSTAYYDAGSLSFSFWAYFSGTPANYPMVLQWRRPSQANATQSMQVLFRPTGDVFGGSTPDSASGNRISFAINGATTATTHPFFAMTANTWQHWAGTYDGSNLRLFNSGVLRMTVAGSFANTAGAWNVDIANNRVSPSDGYLNGQLDDVRLYSRALTEPEIKLLASRPGIGLRQESHRQTFYQFPSGARRKRILTGMP